MLADERECLDELILSSGRYTHSFVGLGIKNPAVWAAIWPSLVADATRLLAAFGPENAGGPSPNDTPIVNEIIFTPENTDSEAFVLRWMGADRRAIVGSRRRAYDEIVTAILLRAVFRLGKDSPDGKPIESAGCWDDWMKGRELVKKVFPDDEIVRSPNVLLENPYEDPTSALPTNEEVSDGERQE